MGNYMSLINRILNRSEEPPQLEGPDYEKEAAEHLQHDRPKIEKDDKRVVGRLIKVDPKGYGFISSKEIPYTRIFFHWTGLLQDTKNFAELENGQFVEFETMRVEGKGVRAIKIRVVNPPANAAEHDMLDSESDSEHDGEN